MISFYNIQIVNRRHNTVSLGNRLYQIISSTVETRLTGLIGVVRDSDNRIHMKKSGFYENVVHT